MGHSKVLKTNYENARIEITKAKHQVDRAFQNAAGPSDSILPPATDAAGPSGSFFTPQTTTAFPSA